ncbi:thioredoxin reductase [Hamadaea flava]|uniref:FAD-dependent oxidoreductase n=1 Tax=Hamadaea flava TaxID=1742688 RepID=A0ABV8M1Y4_9ACTN|nr:thioredoxin reductase [Hamadaea flava]
MSVFCGIGVCQACVAPDGTRPCLTPSVDSQQITDTQAETAPGSTHNRDPQQEEELVVVGAGPAGLSAALAAADAGVRVLVVDRGGKPGGQYLRQSTVRENTPPALIQRAQAHERIRFLLGHEIWRATRDQLEIADVEGRTTRVVRAAAIVLATGAYDRVVPFPGWELPGVVTVGGAQAQLKGLGVKVGQRVLVTGTGPLLLSLAVSLAEAGVEVVAVADPVRSRAWFRHVTTVVRAPRKLLQAAAYRGRLLRHRVPVWAGWEVREITPDRDVMIAKLRCGTKERAEIVDAIAVGHGFTPQVELASALGCALLVDPRDGSPIAQVDADLRTSQAGVFAAGELAGVGGADSAYATGTLAGLAAARHLGRLDESAYQVASKPWRRRAAAARRFADALHKVHGFAPGWSARVSDETVLCRCEGVTFGAVRAAQALGADDPRAVKLLTRAGMGRCQGRLCGLSAADVLGCAPLPYANRPIATPVPMRLLMEEDT